MKPLDLMTERRIYMEGYVLGNQRLVWLVSWKSISLKDLGQILQLAIRSILWGVAVLNG
jgi:hypothetical protein